MASKPPFLTLHPHDEELRDPTREELFNGPKREKLPVAIQQMAEEDTACTFCGVSYFVFSEVQELQATVKRYKKTFHDFVRFMERERQTSQALKTQVLTLKKSFADAALELSTHAQKLALDSQQLRLQDMQLTTQLKNAQRDAELKQAELLQLQAQCRRDEDEWKMRSALTDQKLRNEIVHLSSHLEKCRLQSASQETEYAAEMTRSRATIKELELLVASTRASLSSAERQVVTERDVLKQQLLAANERVDAEKEAAKQLETQLRAVQQELQRVVSSKDSERSVFVQIQSEIGSLKQQLLQHEKAKAVLVSERAELRDHVDSSHELVKTLRVQIATLEKQTSESAASTERCKQEYARELEKTRLEHSQSINRMQRDHQKAVDALKEQQKTYIEFLQKQTSEAATLSASTMQHALVEMETKLLDAEKQAAHWKLEAHQRSDELQSLKLNQQQTTARVHALERELTDLQGEKKELVDETEHLQRQLDQQKAQVKQQIDQAQARTQQHSEEQQIQLQRKIDSLQGKYDHLRRENEQLRAAQAARKTRDDPEEDGDSDDSTRRRPQQAWGDGTRDDGKRASAARSQKARPANGSNQEVHELEKVVESLRHSLEQKDKEIFLLQQTVHRECLERTSLLEKMRSGKVLPDVTVSVSSAEASMRRSSIATPRREQPATNATEADETEERDDSGAADQDPSQPKASFYERLRRAGQRKAKPRKP